MPTCWSRFDRRLLVFLAVAFSTLMAGAAAAQNLRVVPVPWSTVDSSVPHPAFNGHATTFKAIARGGNGTYLFEWDFDADGVFDFSATTGNRYNLSTRFTYPNQGASTTFRAVVRVTSGGEVVSGVYPVRVFADVPNNPANATDRQLQVMQNVAIGDGLWFLHNQMSRSGNESDPLTGAQVTGNLGQNSTASAAGYLWALSLHGHFAAFPAAYVGPMADPAANAARFAGDPFAEDAARLVNYLLTQAQVVGVAAQDEENLVGFYPEEQRLPIDGTDDGIGLYIGSSPGDQTVYYMGHALSALSVANLAGYVAQVGDSNRILGRRMEFVLQQLVDALVWAQNDGGSYPGSWYYSPNANADDLSTTLWGATALWHAEAYASRQGIIVPNRAKTRLASFIFQNSNNCPGAGFEAGALTGGSYNSGQNGVCDHALTAAHLLALGWVGANAFAVDDARLAFPGYNGVTRGQLRRQYNSTLNYMGGQFALSQSTSIGWNTGAVEGGNFARVDGRGNHYDMLHWRDAARAIEPAVVRFGANDWYRLYSQYFVNNQAADGGWNWNFSGGTNANSDNSGGTALRAAWATLVLEPDARLPFAVADADARAGQEGNTFRFDASQSDPGLGDPTYLWDFGNGDVQEGKTAAYRFPDNGVFDVTLTVATEAGTSTDAITLTVDNVPPSVSIGPDRATLEGSLVAFEAAVDDPGVLDTFTSLWDFDGSGANTSTEAAPTFTYPDDGVFTVSLAVTDKDGAVGRDGLVVTVNNVAPSVTSRPPLVATGGVPYQYTLTFTDPGVGDTHTCALDLGPDRMRLTGCTVDWTPDFAQALGGSVPVLLCAVDDDGDRGCQSWDIDLTFVDADEDGLPDAWERDAFGDLAAQDASGDPDADGLDNLDEVLGRTDPVVYDGPSVPATVAPQCASEIASQPATLEVTNATDPQGSNLTYEFELYADAGLQLPVTRVRDLPQGNGRTSWTPFGALAENEDYFWRARAADAVISGGWTPVCSFVVNAVNEAPSAPRPDRPAVDGRVDSLTPTLVVGDAVDPDHDVLTYTWEVYADAGLTSRVATLAGAPDEVGATASFTVAPALEEDRWYWWRARAVDPEGAASPWTPAGRFFASATNTAPGAPTLLLPPDGAVASEHTPTFVALPSTDRDLDPLTLRFELAADDTFARLIASADRVLGPGVDQVTWEPDVRLAEDTHACWRARAHDGTTDGDWAVACFLVSETDNPPSVPVAVSPACGGEIARTSATLEITNATDPQGWGLTYEIELYADAALTRPVTKVSGQPEGLGSTAWTPFAELVENGDYFWRARAANGRVVGDWTPVCGFVVNAANEAPSAPRPSAPAPGGRADASRPTLVVDDAVDPEGDALTYVWEVYADAGATQRVTSAAGTADDAGPAAAWTVDAELGEDHWYWWRARATDIHGADSAWSATGSFFVSAANTAPDAPTLLLPRDGARVVEPTPTFVVLEPADRDLDLLTYDFELATDPTFAALVAGEAGVPARGGDSTTWRPDASLTENARYCWRARASDGAATSDWAVACFHFSATPDAPSVPTLMNPSDQGVVAVARPVFSWTAATDPDSDVVLYTLALFDHADLSGEPVVEVPAIGATSTVLPVDLAHGSTYFWRVRAADEGGATSAWSAVNAFTVQLSTFEGSETDADGDGLPDVWETASFGSTDADPFADPDRDGMNNRQEFDHQTNPTVYDGPSEASATAPACGSAVASANPAFTVSHATDPQNQPLLYTFELYADAAQGELVERAEGLAEGADGQTSWTPAAPLEEDRFYFWRARAADAYTAGPWSEVCSVFVNAGNAAPSVPEPKAPFDGSVVALASPSLAWFAASDPERDAITYDVEVFEGGEPSGTPVFTANDLAATSVALDVALADGPAVWRVRAKDALAAESDWSAVVRFSVATRAPGGSGADVGSGHPPLADAGVGDAGAADAEPSDAPDASADPKLDGASSGGCGCRAAGDRPTGAWLLLLLALGIRSRTRRARRA